MPTVLVELQRLRLIIIVPENKTGIFQHLGRLFLPATLKNVPSSLNKLLVNFRKESSAIWPILQARIPTRGELAQFRSKNRNWENYTKRAIHRLNKKK